MEFRCVQDCSQCCIQREYYPSKEFGKIGVLILPEEKDRIMRLAEGMNLQITILPRIGVSERGDAGPRKVIAYQMMGRDPDGNTCPFLDTESEKRAEHGGRMCRIYPDRPLACSAYPLTETSPVTLDERCKFCKECGSADANLDSETESLITIKSKMSHGLPVIWRYATGVGEEEDRRLFKTGWIRDA